MSKFKLVLFILIFIFPFTFVSANEGNISISCVTQVKINEVFECKIMGSVETKEVSSLNAKFSYSENLELVSFVPDSVWIGNADNNSIDLYTDSNKKENFNIGVFKFKVKNNDISNVNILLYDIFFSDENFNEFPINNSSITMKVVSSNNYLSNLSLSSGNISPIFDRNVSNYKATVNDDKVNIVATSEDKNAIVSGIGVKSLQYGDNMFIITVTSQSSEVREYKLVVTRERKENNNADIIDNKKILSNNNQLKSLNIVGYEIDFISDKLEYFIDVNKDVSYLDVKAEVSDNKSKLVISGNDNLVSGNNKISILVTSESGKTLEYIVNVNKEFVDYTLLKDLVIKGYKIDFQKDKFEYQLKIKQDDKLDISAIGFLDDVNIEILNNYSLKNNSVIEIKVSYENNSSIYKIYITMEVNNKEKKFNIISLIIISMVLIVILFIGIKLFFSKKNMGEI